MPLSVRGANNKPIVSHVPKFPTILPPRWMFDLQRQIMENRAALGDPEARVWLAQHRYGKRLEQEIQAPGVTPDGAPGRKGRPSFKDEDDAIARAVLAKNPDSGVSYHQHSKQNAHLLSGSGREAIKQNRLRNAFRRVTGK